MIGKQFLVPKPVLFVSLADSFIVSFSKFLKKKKKTEQLYRPVKIPGLSRNGSLARIE